MKKVFYNNDIYEVTHTYPSENGDATLMIMYRQPNGWGGYEIKVSESNTTPAPNNAVNKRFMLVLTGWQNHDDVIDEQSRRTYDDIKKDYELSNRNGKIEKD